VLKAQLVQLALKEPRDRPAPKVCKVFRVSREFREILDLLELKVHKDLQV
jgi:hypothetical protein